MMATISAGSYTGPENYPLAGLITSGTGSEVAEGRRSDTLYLPTEHDDFVSFEPNAKDGVMLRLPHMNL